MKAVKQITLPEQVTVYKKMPQKEFKLPVEDSMKIVEEVRKIQKHSKTIRPDQNRKQYQQLLQWVGTRLEATKELVNSQFSCQSKFSEQNHQPQSIEQQIQFQQRSIIQNLMQHMTQLFKRQCKQKSQLMQVCLSYFNQLIHSYTKYYEKEYNQTLNTYNITLTQMQDQYAEKIAECNKKIMTLEGQKQTKWKNIYMLAKDNRILRRQKGKLMRNIQEQEEKMKILEEELCSVTKQNQMNKLIIRFQNDSQNLKVFMKNRLALMKFQKIIERYPKKAMKVLHSDLLKLQIQELNSLDSKIDYIRRVITESGDIFDQYEDLNQLMSKPNKMVFNMYSQTNSEDIEPPKEFKEATTNTELQVTRARFQHWEQLYDIKIVGFPELREKYVCFRNPNKKATINKMIKKKVDNQKKDFFVMQICSRQTFEVVNIRNKPKGQQLRTLPTVGVIYNPKLKNRSKLNFISAFETKFGVSIEDSEVQPNDLVFRQTMPANIKKQSVSKARNLNRKSQSQGFQGKYAYNRLSTQNLQGQKRYSDLSSFQKTVQESRDEQNQTIDEKSQFDSENRSDTYTETQQNKKTDIQENEQFAIKKFKKTTKRATRKTTNELSAFGLERKSSALRNISNQAIESGSAQKLSANVQKMSKIGKSTKTQRISTESGSKRKKPKNSVLVRKSNRIRTTQNERDSKSSSLRKGMDFIEEEQQENQDHQTLSWDKMKQSNRLSYKQPFNSIKSSRFYDTINNLGSIKENYMNEIEGILAERNKKYHMTMMPGQFSANKSMQRSNMRNSSFNLMKFKPRQSIANVDTCSMNSHISSQNESTFNYKNFMTQLKPKQSATQTIQSDHLGLLSLKPFEVKKISQKLVKSIYTRRKQLLSSPSPMNLKNFIQNFLKQIYGNNWKGQKNLLRYAFTIDDRETSSTIKVFTLMMNVNVHVEYLEDLFRLYVTMLERNQYAGDNPLTTNKAKGAAIIKYMLSIYFDENTAIDIQQNLPFMNQYEIDLNEIFVVLEGQLRKNTIQTEIYQFMLKLLPENQSNIEFNQLKEILYLFKNQQKYHTHIARLKYFFKTHGKIVAQQQQAIVSKLQSKGRASNSQKPSTQQKNSIMKDQKTQQIQILPLHRVCLYLKRYQWTDLMDINSFVQQKYHKIIGVFIQQEIIKFITRYCVILAERATGNKKNVNNISAMMMSISVPVQQTPSAQTQVTHPLAWMLERAKQLIRNFYRYKGPLDRYFLMFVHLSILTYELQIGVNDVLCDSLGLMSIEYKKLKTKEEVDLFMKE